MHIKLLPIDEVDIELLKKWQNDINVKYPIMGFRFPIQKKSIEDWLESIRKNNGRSRIVYGIHLNSIAVGMVSLHDIDYVNRNAMFGIYVAEKNERNKGVGKSASIITLDFAFNAMGLKRVGLEVHNKMENAIHMYKKIGFVKEGVKRKAFFIDGSFVDVNFMSLLNSEFILDKTKIKNRLVLGIDL